MFVLIKMFSFLWS